jgi:excisionase family DNA binding protein
MQAQAVAETSFYQPQSDFLLPSEAAQHLRVNERTLEVWRSNKKFALPYIKIGGSVRYRKSDLDRWIESRTVNG